MMKVKSVTWALVLLARAVCAQNQPDPVHPGSRPDQANQGSVVSRPSPEAVAQAKDTLMATYQRVFDVAIAYSKLLREDEPGRLEASLNRTFLNALQPRLDNDQTMFNTVANARNQVSLLLRRGDDYTALDLIQQTFWALHDLKGQLLAFSLWETDPERKSKLLHGYQQISDGILDLRSDFQGYYGQLNMKGTP
jgi:hypothetical protein